MKDNENKIKPNETKKMKRSKSKKSESQKDKDDMIQRRKKYAEFEQAEYQGGKKFNKINQNNQESIESEKHPNPTKTSSWNTLKQIEETQRTTKNIELIPNNYNYIVGEKERSALNEYDNIKKNTQEKQKRFGSP